MKQKTNILVQFKQWILSIVMDSAKTEPKKSDNPYGLLWYKQGWSATQIAKHNTKYWQCNFTNLKY